MELDDAPQLTAALHALAHDPSQRDATLELLHASLNSKTLRDVDPDAAVYAALFEALHAAWSFFDDGALERVHAWLAGVLQLLLACRSRRSSGMGSAPSGGWWLPGTSSWVDSPASSCG